MKFHVDMSQLYNILVVTLQFILDCVFMPTFSYIREHIIDDILQCGISSEIIKIMRY